MISELSWLSERTWEKTYQRVRESERFVENTLGSPSVIRMPCSVVLSADIIGKEQSWCSRYSLVNAAAGCISLSRAESYIDTIIWEISRLTG